MEEDQQRQDEAGDDEKHLKTQAKHGHEADLYLTRSTSDADSIWEAL
ncbi:hypothetical protein JCM9957A_72170 [Kineosporia succinea]